MRPSRCTWPYRFAVLTVACWMSACLAAGPPQALAQLDHAMWTARDGAPQGIKALVQGPDGTLWVGGETGLLNFDGRTFTRFKSPRGEPELPSVPVLSILAAKDGALWVGFFQAGLARIANGRVTVYSNADKQPIAAAENIRESADGTLWAIANQASLIRFGKDGAWHLEPAPAASRITGIFVDSSNVLWIGQAGRLHRRPLSQASYLETKVPADVIFAFAEAAMGNVWMADVNTDKGQGRAQLVDPLGNLITELRIDNPSAIARTPDNSLLVAFQNDGLGRLDPTQFSMPARRDVKVELDPFTSANGLSSNRTSAMIGDADGNIWVGGNRGLDRLRTSRLTRFLSPQASRWQVCNGKQGDLWLANTSGSLTHISPAGVTRTRTEVGDIYELKCKDNGTALVVTPQALYEAHPDRLVKIPPIPGIRPWGMLGLAASSDGTLYARTSGPFQNGGGIWRLSGGQWKFLSVVGVPGAAGSIAYFDSQDRLWTGMSHDRVLLGFPENRQVFFSGKPGLGWVFAILQTTHGIFAAGTNGLAALRDKNFEMLAFEDPVPSRGVRGLVESRNGDLWMNTAHAVVRIPAGELKKGLADASYRMKSEVIAEGEFAGSSQGISGSTSTAARDGQGRLWFATRDGVVYLDPEQPPRQRRPPVVTIRSVEVDRRPVDARTALDPRPQTLAIQYLGVNLTEPESVVYRYRLEGLDDAWQEAGRRTEAVYSRLQPGTYTFRVSASNGDGAWTVPVSSSSFTVPPSFYQTTWFAMLCALVAVAIVWLAFTMRIRTVTRVVRARAEERADERIRIARELHDTLLQGIQGLLLTFHVVAEKMSANDESKPVLERALSTADRIILEGRNRVGSLRSEHVTDPELIGALQNAANDLNPDHKVQCVVKRSGIAATLHPHVADEVFFIAREALTNAFRHAEASQIGLELHYGARYFSLVCNDDGRGFGREERERTGHWGLQGIEERARKLGGQVSFVSEPGHGARITVAIPSYQAYVSHSRLMFYLNAWRFSERNPLRQTRG